MIKSIYMVFDIDSFNEKLMDQFNRIMHIKEEDYLDVIKTIWFPILIDAICVIFDILYDNVLPHSYTYNVCHFVACCGIGYFTYKTLSGIHTIRHFRKVLLKMYAYVNELAVKCGSKYELLSTLLWVVHTYKPDYKYLTLASIMMNNGYIRIDKLNDKIKVISERSDGTKESLTLTSKDIALWGNKDSLVITESEIMNLDDVSVNKKSVYIKYKPNEDGYWSVDTMHW